MTEDRERPFGMALVAAWFVLGATALLVLVRNLWRATQIVDSALGDNIIRGAMVLYVLAAVALAAIAANIWRERPRVRGVACLVLAATAAVAVWRATTPWHWAVAAINVAAMVYLVRYRARSM
jgi:hypothetical protein